LVGERPTIQTRGDWGRLLAGLVAVYVLFQAIALTSDSTRGEFGILIACLVVLALVLVEVWLFRVPARSASFELGLGTPRRRGIVASALVSFIFLGVIPLSTLFGSQVSIAQAWWLMLLGLFAQAGIAEEVLFRGYLFHHLKQGREFWRAALLSALPFAFIHLGLFVVLPYPLAFASLALALVMTPPLSHLFVLGGNTIWPPALLHFVVQGGLKIVELGPDDDWLPLAWIGASALIPYLAFCWRRPENPARGRA
jgi:membrane protease YdiL (CAAX protease family)